MSQGSQNATGQCHNTTQVNVVTTEFSDLATNCPEYKVDGLADRAVQRTIRVAGRI